MNFSPENFRSFDAETPAWVNIRVDDKSPLILIKASGEAVYARSAKDKDALLARFDEANDLLLWPWSGQYRTDVFRLSKSDLNKFYQRAR